MGTIKKIVKNMIKMISIKVFFVAYVEAQFLNWPAPAPTLKTTTVSTTTINEAEGPCGKVYVSSDPDSGCFAQNSDGHCEIANPACLSLKCSATGMTGFLRGDVLGYDLADLPDASAVEVNEVQNCVGFTKSGQGYNFDLTYGDCDMRISQEENKIIFKSVFTDHPANGHGVEEIQDSLVFRQEYFNKRPIIVECEFGDTVTTDATLTISTNELGGLGIKESDLQFNLRMSFWDDNFQNVMATESQQSLNKKTNIQISNPDPIDAVSFYITECRVSDASNYINVLDDGCPIEVLNVDDNGSQISSSQLKYSWDSFVFTEKAGHNSMKLTCEVQFCVKEKCQPNICE